MVSFSPWRPGLTHLFDNRSDDSTRAWVVNPAQQTPQDEPPVVQAFGGGSSSFGFFAAPGYLAMDGASCAAGHARLGSQPQGVSDYQAWAGTCPEPYQPMQYPKGNQGLRFTWNGGTLDATGQPNNILWRYGYQSATYLIQGLDATETFATRSTKLLPYDYASGEQVAGVDWGEFDDYNDLTLTRIEYLGYDWAQDEDSEVDITPKLYIRVERDGEQRLGWWGNKFPGDASTIDDWKNDGLCIGPFGPGQLDLGDNGVLELPEHWMPLLQLAAGDSASLSCIWVSKEWNSANPFTPVAGRAMSAGGVATRPHFRFYFQSADYRLIYDTTRPAPPCRLFPRDDGLGTSSAARIFPPSKLRQRSNRPNATY